ncbi:hypothetical protein Unana1_06525 [Umbelopsis nana]
MSSYKTVAVAGGFGDVGHHIVSELLNAGYQTRILTRASPNNEKQRNFEKRGARIITVDYSDQASLTEAFSGADVVINALSYLTIPDVALHIRIVDAAIAANTVKHYFPSEYSWEPQEQEQGFLSSITDIRKYVYEHADILPYTITTVGQFTDSLFNPAQGFDIENNKATVVGEGNTPLTFTTMSDAAKYIVLSLKEPDQFLNGQLKMSSGTNTINEAFGLYEKISGRKLNITYLDKEAAGELIAKNEDQAYTFALELLYGIEEGYCLLSDPWSHPDVTKITVEQYLTQKLK